MVKFKKKTPICIACGDTGKNSKGGSCYPCKIAGRKTNEPKKEIVEKAPVKKVAAPKKRLIKFKFKKK